MLLIIFIVFIVSIIVCYALHLPRHEIIDGYNIINHIYGKFRLIEIQDFLQKRNVRALSIFLISILMMLKPIIREKI